MATKQITLTLPEELYDEIVQAKQEDTAPSMSELTRQIISERLQLRQWQHNLEELQQEVRRSGGLGLSKTKGEVIRVLRKT